MLYLTNPAATPRLGTQTLGGMKMGRNTRLLWILGFFGLFGAANAQTSSPSIASTQFDGTYAFGTSTRVNETDRARGIFPYQCREYPNVLPLIIVNGQARRYSKGGLLTYEGTVGPHGELAMRNVPTPANKGVIPGIERVLTGRIYSDGTVRARQISDGCNYDLIWQKISSEAGHATWRPPRSPCFRFGLF
jgi:hypothetical protein